MLNENGKNFREALHKFEKYKKKKDEFKRIFLYNFL